MRDEDTPPQPEEAPAEPGEEPRAEVPEAPSLEDKLAAVEKERKELYERLLRTAADFDNFRKRSRRDVDEARLKAREEVLRDMLPGVDNLERALAVAGEGGGNLASVVDGVKLVLRQFLSALDRFDVRPFSSVGEAFDPTRHEAISHVETVVHPPGTVEVEMQKGYTQGTRLLRPALVSVAKAPAKPEPERAPEPDKTPE